MPLSTPEDAMAYRSSQFSLKRDVDRLFEDPVGSDANGGHFPVADVHEDDAAIVIELELPGVRLGDVEVTAERGGVTIRGEKRSVSRGSTEVRYSLAERTCGAFARSFPLPDGVDARRIEAALSDGVLVVRVPKTAVTRPQRIEVRDGGTARE